MKTPFSSNKILIQSFPKVQVTFSPDKGQRSSFRCCCFQGHADVSTLSPPGLPGQSAQSQRLPACTGPPTPWLPLSGGTWTEPPHPWNNQGRFRTGHFSPLPCQRVSTTHAISFPKQTQREATQSASSWFLILMNLRVLSLILEFSQHETVMTLALIIFLMT